MFEPDDESNSRLLDDLQTFHETDEPKSPANSEGIDGSQAYLEDDEQQRQRYILPVIETTPEDTSQEVTPQVRVLHRKSPLQRTGVDEKPFRFSNGNGRHLPPSTKVPKTPPTTPMTDFAPTSAGGSTTANTLFSPTPLQSRPAVTLFSPESPGLVSTDGGRNDRPIEMKDRGYLSSLLNTPTPVGQWHTSLIQSRAG
ncbi:hypothetical protein BDR22DRAFT_238371 [Usnea florida]